MKIIKENKLNESIRPLTEAEETVVDVKVEDDGSGTLGVGVKPATKAEAIKVRNALTDVLDDALADAKEALLDENYSANCNVLVTGLPGSSKTATVKEWCVANGCNYFYLDSKNPDIQLLTSGASSIDRTDPAHPKVNPAYSNALAKLDRPNSILFLDELNRQIKEYLRGSLLTLIADRQVAGDGPEGFRTFPNLLFTIACTNPPAGDKDRGATKLNDAEKRRFYYHVIFNSEKATTTEYFNKFYDKRIRDAAALPKDNERRDVRINRACLSQWLGNKIVNHPDFKYSEFKDLVASTEQDKKIMCQSLITELIDHSYGDLGRLRKDIQRSGLLPDAIDMLNKILATIVLPDLNALRAKKGRELGLDLGTSTIPVEEPTGKPAEPKGEEEEEFDFSGDDDDKDFLGTGADEEKVKLSKKSPLEAARDLSSFSDTLHF